MAVSNVLGGLDPVSAIAVIGVIGVGAQWLAWRLQIPAIVLMLLAGIIVGPVMGIMVPSRDLGPIFMQFVGIAVAVILFEGGLSLNRHGLKDAQKGVMRLVVIGAPLGWVLATLTLYYCAGLGWASSAVFGGILIVTGPTVIAPLLRQAKLNRRPAALLQWEAIVNDPIGALAAVFAFEVVLVASQATTVSEAIISLVIGLSVATVLGVVAGFGLVFGFRRGLVPEYMKVPVLFVVLIAVFAGADRVLHESGLLSVTVMGMLMANLELPSYTELRRFKEHATILLVSGVFILLAANLDFATLALLNWQALLFVGVIMCFARPVTVFISLIGSGIPLREQFLVAFTGPRGVVLVAVAGLFGERLFELGISDGALIGPLAFLLVAISVVVHGFGLRPMAQTLGLTAEQSSGVLIVGASTWANELAHALTQAEIPTVLTDTNMRKLRQARESGLNVFYGDILSHAAEDNIDLHHYDTLIAVSESDAYNTLVTSDLAPEFGRQNVFQLSREKQKSQRHQLPVTIGGQPFGKDMTYVRTLELLNEGWNIRVSKITDSFTIQNWLDDHPQSIILAQIEGKGHVKFLTQFHTNSIVAGNKIVHFSPAKQPELNKQLH